MSDKTKIEWTDATWNPVTGCTKVSPGCDHCYAEGIAHRFAGTKAYPDGFQVTLRPDRLDQPLRWAKPRRVFVNSMSDLFHDDIPDDYIARVFAIMALAPEHTFQLLTKRPGRMRSLMRSAGFYESVRREFHAYNRSAFLRFDEMVWPRPNVWLGVSAEDQRWADVRIPVLLDTPAAVRFVSAEPLLGPIRLAPSWLRPDALVCGGSGRRSTEEAAALSSVLRAAVRKMRAERCDDPPAWLDWLIVGGESGHGARPMHPDWARSLRDQCAPAGVAFHFKQWGEWRWAQEAEDREYEREHGDLFPEKRWEVLSSTGVVRSDNVPRAGDAVVQRVGKRAAGRDLDGRTWDEFPDGAA